MPRDPSSTLLLRLNTRIPLRSLSLHLLLALLILLLLVLLPVLPLAANQHDSHGFLIDSAIRGGKTVVFSLLSYRLCVSIITLRYYAVWHSPTFVR